MELTLIRVDNGTARLVYTDNVTAKDREFILNIDGTADEVVYNADGEETGVVRINLADELRLMIL